MGVDSEDQESTQILEVHSNESDKKMRNVTFKEKFCDFCLKSNHLARFCRAKKKVEHKQEVHPKIKTE